MNCLRSVFRRFRHALAWDRWRVRRKLPAGFRLRRYVALNGAGAVAAFFGMIVSTGCLGNGLIGNFTVLVLLWTFFRLSSRARIHPEAPAWRSWRLWLSRTAYCAVVALWFAAVSELTSFRGSPFFVLLAAYLVFLPSAMCALRISLAPKSVSADTEGTFIDTGRMFAGVARPVLLVMTLVVALESPPSPSPVRLSDAAEALLFDETGTILKPPVFPCNGGWQDSEYDAFRANLLSGLGNPPPPETALVMSLADAGFDKMPDSAKDILSMCVSNRIDAISFDGVADGEFDGWMERQEAHAAKLGKTTPGPMQIGVFMSTNEARSSLVESFGFGQFPTFAGVFQHVSADLAIGADSPDAGRFVEALDRAAVRRESLAHLRGGVIPSRLAVLIERLAADAIVRFAARTDIGTNDIAAVFRQIDAAPEPSLSEAGAAGLADETLRTYLWEPRRVWQEVGWLLLRGAPSSAESFLGENPPFGRVRRWFGGLAMTAFGCPCETWIFFREHAAKTAIRRIADHSRPPGGRRRFDDDFRDALESISSTRVSAPGLFADDGIWSFANDVGPGESSDRLQADARYADSLQAVEKAALALAWFRAVNDREAETLEEAAEAAGVEVPKPDPSFLALRHEYIAGPEAEFAPKGAGAHLLALLPTFDAPHWFSGTGNGMAWLVVRNPVFSGSLPYRVYKYDGEGNSPVVHESALSLLPSVSDIRFLSVSGPEGVAEAERRLKDAGWSL